MDAIVQVSLRQSALFIPRSALLQEREGYPATLGALLSHLARGGYSVSEPLLAALKRTTPGYLAGIESVIGEVLGLKKGWTPLVKGWDQPTGESALDHLLTFFANLFGEKGTRLSCGHVIPPHTFPLERYNGCPFCGTLFQFGELEHYRQGSTIKVLELWTEKEASQYLEDLLTSATALDATDMDSLKRLLSCLPLPPVSIRMKETLMAVIEVLIGQGKAEAAQQFFTSPADILRFLWYRHTGFLQVVEPGTILRRVKANNRHITPCLDRSASARLLSKATLRLKYSRKECIMVAGWLNNLEDSAERICEAMHPRRPMWVRFIRALRLAEYSRRTGFGKLRDILDVFYKETYAVWQGQVDRLRLRDDCEGTLHLLKQRPGSFARSLFAQMLWFPTGRVVAAFSGIIDKVPTRLVVTLDMYAENYFEATGSRVVKPLGGVSKRIGMNPLTGRYTPGQLEGMKKEVRALCELAIRKRFAALPPSGKTIYIEPGLLKIPLSIGDRGETVQDTASAVMGTRFEVEGTTVRLFMQWGTGLAAQHLDMDLSCSVSYERSVQVCSFSSLSITGCRHSGDIRSIPNHVGTAEYIDIDLEVLERAGARFVAFTCNAYSAGSIAPNLVVGWMNSRYPMKISEHTGVAFDPSCVQHQVRITGTLTKGLLFGVLNIAAREITWCEMPFSSQVVQGMDAAGAAALVRKLENKMTIGQLLRIKAEAQGLEVVAHAGADEAYTVKWARNTAAVTGLLADPVRGTTTL